MCLGSVDILCLSEVYELFLVSEVMFNNAKKTIIKSWPFALQMGMSYVCSGTGNSYHSDHTGYLFYPTTTVWHFQPLPHLGCGRLKEWAALILQKS